jgi:enoyl-CoA hydratase
VSRTLHAERDGRVLVVRVDNPPHNFMDRGMVAELDGMVRTLRRDRAVGSVLITGRPPDLFVTHYDVAEILAGVEAVGVTPGPRAAGAMLGFAGALRRIPGVRALAERTPVRGLFELQKLHGALLGLNRLDKVVIAAINGPATGGGCELALACDLRYVADRPGLAIGLPEMTMGFNPGAGGTQRLTRVLGPGRALEAMLEGRTFTPAEALDAGIVHRVTEPGSLLDEAMETAERMARRAPASVRALKASVYEGGSSRLTRGLAEERRRFMSVGGREPATRAMGAFVEEVERRGGSPWADREAIEPWQRGEVEDMGPRDA